VPDPNILFTITATARSSEGAIADLVQVVYKPVAATGTQTADEAQLDAECEWWRTAIPSASYVEAAITATDRSPAGSAWEEAGFVRVPLVFMEGFSIFDGSTWGAEAACSFYFLGIGASRGMTPVSDGPADSPYGWANVSYGFGSYNDYGDDGFTLEVTDCTIELSQYAVDNSAIAATWTAQLGAQNGGCTFGEPTITYLG
jgi:hypothetical protein